MATYTAFHSRSISLPFSSHPTESHFDEQLSRLRSCEFASTSSSITQRLNNLKDLYVCVDDLLQLPSNFHALSQDRQLTSDILEASLSLLDVFVGARDVLSQIKEHVQDIQSALCRRCSGNLCPTNKTAAYIKCRKEVQKVVKSLFTSIKHVQKICNNNMENINSMPDALIKMEGVTAELLESFLAHIARPKKQSLVSKIIGHVQKEESSEFANMDSSIQLMISQKNCNIESVQGQMGDLELTIQDFSEVMESLFRCSLKTRTNILNILSH